MEDQGKRLLLAVALCMVILFVGTWLFGPKGQQPQPTTPATPPGQTTPPATAQPGTPSTPPAPGAPPAAEPRTERGPDEPVSLTTPDYVVTFSRHGGALKSWKLSGSQYTEKGSGGKRVPMDMVRTADNPAWYPLQLSIPGLPRDVDWTLEKLSDTELRASWREAGKLEVIKKFTVKPPLYAMEMSIEITNLATQEVEQHLAVDLFGFQDPNTGSSGMFKYVPPTWGTVCYQDGKARGDSVGSLMGREPKQRGGAVRYAGLQHKYFLLAVAPKPSDDRYSCTLAAAPDRPGVMLATLNYATTVKLPPQQKMVRQLVVYSGPKLLGQLEQVSKLLGGDTQLTATVDWGPPPTKWFTFIARPMLWLLGVFHGWVANWGIAIILLTITVKLLTLYWTQKSMRSMKSMAKLKPKMDEIRAKWPGDKQRQNQEMMNLYKTHNINPLGGCLPMLLQMPVWMALYSALGAAAELYQAPFVGWLDDLTAPDPYFIMPVSLTAMMFLQSKLSPAAVDSAQQKMMMYFMPIMFGFFSLFFPTGLTVYIFTNTVLGMAHQVYMNKTDAAAAAPAAKATAPAGDAPAARPAQAPPRKKKKKAS